MDPSDADRFGLPGIAQRQPGHRRTLRPTAPSFRSVATGSSSDPRGPISASNSTPSITASTSSSTSGPLSVNSIRPGPEIGPARTANQPGPSRYAGTARRPPPGASGDSAIDLTENDSDDDVIITGVRGPAASLPTRNGGASTVRPIHSGQAVRPAAPTARHVRGIEQNDFNQEMNNITEAIERHRRDTDALLAADREDERRRLILSPPARSAPPAHQPNQPRIRLGGAVLRRGDQQINYAAQAGQRGNPTITAGLRHPPDDPRDPARRVMPAPARRWDDGEFDRYQRTRDLEEYLFDDDEEGDPLDEYVPPEGNPNYRDPLVPRPGPLGAGLAHRAGAQGLLERLLGILPGTHRRDPTLGLAPDIAAILGRAGPAFRGGAAAGEEGVAEVLERVAPFHYPPAKMDFTTNFEFDLADKQPISVDDNGNVVDKPKTKSKPFLSCVRCHDPLLNSSHYRSDDDRIWALRCGHLIDQKCLVKISVPESDTASGTDKDEPPVKRPARRRKAAPKKNVQPPPEYTYACPVEGCTGKCVSISGDDGWEQKHGHGALVAFV